MFRVSKVWGPGVWYRSCGSTTSLGLRNKERFGRTHAVHVSVCVGRVRGLMDLILLTSIPLSTLLLLQVGPYRPRALKRARDASLAFMEASL